MLGNVGNSYDSFYAGNSFGAFSHLQHRQLVLRHRLLQRCSLLRCRQPLQRLSQPPTTALLVQRLAFDAGNSHTALNGFPKSVRPHIQCLQLPATPFSNFLKSVKASSSMSSKPTCLHDQPVFASNQCILATNLPVRPTHPGNQSARLHDKPIFATDQHVFASDQPVLATTLSSRPTRFRDQHVFATNQHVFATNPHVFTTAQHVFTRTLSSGKTHRQRWGGHVAT